MINLTVSELHQKAIRISKELRKCENELISILGTIDDKKSFIAYGCANIFIYAEKFLHLKEKKTYDLLSLYRASKSIPALKKEIEGGITLYHAKQS